MLDASIVPRSILGSPAEGRRLVIRMSNKENFPPEFKCPLTLDVMNDPVITVGGHTYERAAITEWFAQRSTDPMTNVELKSTVLIPNLSIRSQIQRWNAKKKVVSGSWDKTVRIREGSRLALMENTLVAMNLLPFEVIKDIVAYDGQDSVEVLMST